MAVKFKDTININGQYTLPLTDGTDGQVLVTDGSGNLTFSSESIAGSADSAESTHLNVKNTSGASIAKGTPVYVTGSVGNTDKLEIAPADASNASHMPAIGLLESTLANNGEGFVVQGGLLKGLVTDTIDGSASTANDTVYVKAGGGLTLTKPTGSTNFIQNIAKVARVHNGNGSLIVSSILRTNDVPNLSTGKIWVGDSNTIESTVVHIDETNGRLGIGTDSPDTLLDVAKDGIGNDAPIIRITNKKGIGNWSAVTDSMGKLEFYSDDSSGNAPYATGFVSVENDFTTGAPTLPSGALVFGTATYNASGGAVERMRIDSSGRVGIGVTPNAFSSTGGSLSIGTQGNIGGGYKVGSLNFITGDSTFTGNYPDGITGEIASVSEGAAGARYDMVFLTADGDGSNSRGERMRIDSSGRVGIGMTPSNYSGYMLQINGGTQSFMSFGNSATGTGALNGLVIGNDSTGADIYQREEQPLRFHTNNIERMRIDSSGNVGIGTTSPGGKLDIKTPMGTSGQFDGAQLRLESTNTVDTTGFQGIRFATSTTPNYGWSMGANRSGSGRGSFRFFEHINSITGVERFTIKQDGNVGIGTDNPNFLLTLNAPTGGALQWQYNGGSYLRIEADSGGGSYYAAAGFYHRFFTSGAERMRIDSAGVVKIFSGGGTSEKTYTALAGLQLYSQQSDAGSPYTKTSDIVANGDGTVPSELRMFTKSNGSSAPTERLRIDSSGKVGIGTTNPSNTTHIYKNATIGAITSTTTANAGLRIQDSGANMYFDGNSIILDNTGYLTTNGAHDFVLGTNNTPRIHIDSGGNVGIGTTSPSRTLEVNSGTASDIAKIGNNSGAFTFGYSASLASIDLAASNAFRIRQGGVVPFYIKTDGNVGIGTTSPSSMLHLESANSPVLTIKDTTQGATLLAFSQNADSHIGTYSNHSLVFDTNSTERMRISSGGVVTAVVDFRAPIFYDTDNTGYYVDPAGTSIQNFIKIYSPTPNLAIEDSNNAGGGGALGIITFRNTGGKAIGIGYTNNETTNSDLIISTNAASTYGGYLGLDAGAISDSQADIILDPKTKVRVHSNLSFGIPGNGQNTNGRFLSIEGNTDASGEGSGRIFFTEHNSTTGSMSNYGMSLGYRGGGTSVVGADGNTWTGLTAVGNGWWGMWGHDGSPTGSLIMSGPRTGAYVNFSQSSGVRAQIYYDLNDTNYYIDPNSTTTAGFIRGKLLIGTNNTWGKTIQIGGNGREYVNNTNVASVVTTNGNLHLDAASGSETFINYYDGNKVHFGNGSNGTVGEIHSDGSARFPIFYDWNSTAYYVDPAGQSRMGNIERNTHSTGFLVGSYNSVGANSAKTNPIYTIGNNYKPTDTSIAGMYGIGYAHGNLWGSGKTPGWGLYVAAAGGYNCTIGDGSTTIWAQNDIVAYSDKRVKDNIEIIPDAVEKVKQLNGVTFTRTDANEEDKNKRHTGVIAQDVLKVLPEAVVGSEEDLYSVAYGNMVGLLIEAIKEQQTQIDELKQLINKK